MSAHDSNPQSPFLKKSQKWVFQPTPCLIHSYSDSLTPRSAQARHWDLDIRLEQILIKQGWNIIISSTAPEGYHGLSSYIKTSGWNTHATHGTLQRSFVSASARLFDPPPHPWNGESYFLGRIRISRKHLLGIFIAKCGRELPDIKIITYMATDSDERSYHWQCARLVDANINIRARFPPIYISSISFRYSFLPRTTFS